MVDAAKKAGFQDDLSKPTDKTVAPAAAAADPAIVGETKPAAAAAADPAKAAEAAQNADDFKYSFEQDGFVGAKDLAAQIDGNEALKAALPKEVRDVVMANARLAEDAAAFREVFASPAEGKIVKQAAETLTAFAEAVNLCASDPEKGTTAFIQKLLEQSMLKNPDGTPRKGENGQNLYDGTASKLLTTAAKRWVAINVVQKVAELKDESVSAALDLVLERVGLRPSTAAKTGDQDPAIAQQRATLERERTELANQRDTQRKQNIAEYKTALDGDLDSLYTGEVGLLFSAASAVDEFLRGAVEKELATAVIAARKSSSSYNMRKSEIEREPMSAERRQKEVAHAKGWLRDNMVRIAQPIFTKAGISISKKAAAAAATSAARAEAARSEVGGGAVATQHAKPAASQDPASQRTAAVEAFKAANGGRTPADDSELNIFMMTSYATSRGLAA